MTEVPASPSPPASSAAVAVAAPVPPPQASIQNTAVVGLSGGSATSIAIWACHPIWPPPPEIIAAAVGAALPVLHMIGRGIYNRIAAWSGVDQTIQPVAVLVPGDSVTAVATKIPADSVPTAAGGPSAPI